MGLLNTSGNPHALTYPIPANDNSVEVVGLFLMLVKRAVASGKAKRAAIALKRKVLVSKKDANQPQRHTILVSDAFLLYLNNHLKGKGKSNQVK